MILLYFYSLLQLPVTRLSDFAVSLAIYKRQPIYHKNILKAMITDHSGQISLHSYGKYL
jgi:hypothetical protein